MTSAVEVPITAFRVVTIRPIWVLPDGRRVEAQPTDWLHVAVPEDEEISR